MVVGDDDGRRVVDESSAAVVFILLQQQASQEKLVVLRKHRQRIKSEANWKLFYYQFNRDHSRPNLVWNFKVLTSRTFSLFFLKSSFGI